MAQQNMASVTVWYRNSTTSEGDDEDAVDENSIAGWLDESDS